MDLKLKVWRQTGPQAPGHFSAVGMLLYAHRTRATRAAEDNSLRARIRELFAASF